MLSRLATAAPIVRRAALFERAAASSGQQQVQQQQQRDLGHLFRPVYSLHKRPEQDSSLRFANTSSGIYAPSTIYASKPLASSEPHNHLTLFNDSDHLPTLPVPSLHATLEKLKESISPVAMNSAEFVNTLQLIDQFGQTAGAKLDSLLREKAQQTRNWMTHDWWVREVYLKSRKPLVINSNPSMIYPVLPFDVNNQRALVNAVAQLTSGIIDFKLALIHGYNPEATNAQNEFRLDPNLCYDQYKCLFGSIRLPGEHVDTVKCKQLAPSLEEPFTFVISYRGRFFEVQLQDVEDESGRIDQIASVLDKIIASTDQLADNDLEGPGVLTSTNRADWARAIKLLDQESMAALQEV